MRYDVCSCNYSNSYYKKHILTQKHSNALIQVAVTPPTHEIATTSSLENNDTFIRSMNVAVLNKTFDDFRLLDCKFFGLPTTDLELRNRNVPIHYGEIARTNGLKFEYIVNERFNKEDIYRVKLIDKIVLYSKYNKTILMSEGKLECIDKKKVKSIYSKLTTSKSDLYFKCRDEKIGVSVKMSNKGTQLQVVSIDNFQRYMMTRGCKFPSNIKHTFEKFCGIHQPSQKELLSFNRPYKFKHKKRYWMNELSKEEQENMCHWLNKYRNVIFEFIFKDGMCKEEQHKAKIFIVNDSYYTQTKVFDPYVFTYEDVMDKNNNSAKITEKGNLELNSWIGLQMKGSGKGSGYHSLQFKDRGWKIEK